MLKAQDILELLKTVPEGYLKPSDQFFAPANSNILQTYRKLGAINSADIDNLEDSLSPSNQCTSDKEIFCNVLKCNLVFDNVASYQSHYNSMHRFICSECKKSLPTEHLLDLHLTECHDTYFEVRIERGERLYKCYLEECKDLFANAKERKEHCIKQHKFPSNFRFDQMTFKNKKPTKTESEYSMDVVEDENRLTNKVKEPMKTFSFGHQKEKTFQLNTGLKSKRESGKTLENLDSLKEALNSM